MKINKNAITIHVILIIFAVMTLLPFIFMVNSVFLTKAESTHSFFSIPGSLKGIVKIAFTNKEKYQVVDNTGRKLTLPRGEAFKFYINQTLDGPRNAWKVVRGYTFNTLFVAILTAFGVCLFGSSSAYIFSRYKFWGRKTLFMVFLATMMFPGVLTLVPSFMLIKKLNLINSYWAMILPYVAGGQVFAIFVFKSFFAGLPEDLFESARIDGAGHLRLYWNIVLPLSKPVFSVVVIMNVLGTWNSFLWPFIVNNTSDHQVIAAGLYLMQETVGGAAPNLMYAAYALSSIPLLILFVYATKPFIEGMTQGAFKA